MLWIMSDQSTSAVVVLRFLEAVAEGHGAGELESFLHPDFRQRELPSLVKPWVAERGRAETVLGAEAGRQLLASQRYDVDEVVECGERVVLQLRWTGVLAIEIPGPRGGR